MCIVNKLSDTGFIRVSVGVNNNEVDIARFLGALDLVLTMDDLQKFITQSKSRTEQNI